MFVDIVGLLMETRPDCVCHSPFGKINIAGRFKWQHGNGTLRKFMYIVIEKVTNVINLSSYDLSSLFFFLNKIFDEKNVFTFNFESKTEN